jgi:hypothetical protein
MHVSTRAVRTLVVLALLTLAGRREVGAQGAPAKGLEGLTRPAVPRVSARDSTFCTVAAMRTWLAGVRRQLQQVDQAIAAVREYGDNVTVRTAALEHYPPVDAAADNALKAESKWADGALDQLEKEKAALLAAVKKAKVIDCGGRVAAPPDTGHAADGLVRPNIPRYLTLHDTVFCTEAELRGWLGSVVLSVLQQIDRAIAVVDAYDDDVSARLAAAERYRSVSAVDLNTLLGESEWARARLDELDKAKKATLDAAKNSKVIDCSPHLAVPRDSVPPEDSVPRQRVRAVPAPGVMQEPRGVFFRGRFGVDWFMNLGSTAGGVANVARVDADQKATGFNVGIGYEFSRRWRFDFSWLTNKVDYNQAFNTGQSSSGTVTGQFISAAAGFNAYSHRKSTIYLRFGPVLAFDRLRYTPIPNPTDATNTRSLTTVKGLLGAEYGYQLNRRWELTVGPSFMSGTAAKDADRVVRLDAGFNCKF